MIWNERYRRSFRVQRTRDIEGGGREVNQIGTLRLPGDFLPDADFHRDVTVLCPLTVYKINFYCVSAPGTLKGRVTFFFLFLFFFFFFKCVRIFIENRFAIDRGISFFFFV